MNSRYESGGRIGGRDQRKAVRDVRGAAARGPSGERLPLHDRGKVLTQAMLMLVGGGESCADIEALRAQERLFGAVPSDSTLYRTFRHQIDPATLAGLWAAIAGIRAEVWRRSSVTNNDEPVVLDIDATLVEVHSENKEGTAATYKRGFGFHRASSSSGAMTRKEFVMT